MKKLTILLAAVLAVSCSSKKNNAEVESAAEDVQIEQVAPEVAMQNPIEISMLEQEYMPSASEKDATGYSYKWVTFVTDFAKEGRTLDGTYDGLALTFVGEPFQFRFQVESFNEEGNAKDNVSAVYWLTGEHSEPVLATLDSAVVAGTCNEETTVYFQLPAEITERFADGNAGMHIHFGDQGSVGGLTITKAVLFQTK